MKQRIIRAIAKQMVNVCAHRLAIPPAARWRDIIVSLADGIVSIDESGEAPEEPESCRSPQELGSFYEQMLRAEDSAQKKSQGIFYTPQGIAKILCEKARVTERTASIIDPACGTGSILLEVAQVVRPEAIFGMDIDPIAVWIARFSLAIETRRTASEDLEMWKKHIVAGDALSPEAATRTYQVVVGNPPWVSFAGRSAAPLSEEQRRDFRQRFKSFSRFPTLHGMFGERCAQLLEADGRMAILVPTSMADLDGYSSARQAISAEILVDHELDELGFGQFEGVVQPTLVLSGTRIDQSCSSPAPWKLGGKDKDESKSLPKSLLDKLSVLRRFKEETFGELGFQSAGNIAKDFIGEIGSDPRFSIPLREGSDVVPFACLPPTIALDDGRDAAEAMAKAKCRLRPVEAFTKATVIIRQTARYPIAARHHPPEAFRNSLIAAFTADPLVLCAILNSSLIRALHLSSQRDGRQLAFPQLKVAHLRALPAPKSGRGFDRLRAQAAIAEEAQLKRMAAQKAYGKAPRTAFEVHGDSIQPAPSFTRTLKTEEDIQRYRATLEIVDRHWKEAHAAIQACDEIVFSMYDVSDEERRAVLEALEP